MCHFCRSEAWASTLGSQSIEVARLLLGDSSELLAREAGRRLAFRELGTCLGLKCYGVDNGLTKRVDDLIVFWRRCLGQSSDEQVDLRPITLVMYAAALAQGGKIPFLDLIFA